jgi:hypothetical protein
MKEIKEMMKQAQTGYEAVITEIVKTNNHAFFKSESFDKRDGYAVTFTLDLEGKEEPETWTEFFGTPSPRGFPQSKVGLFCRKYDTYPQEKMKVKAEINEDGFFRCLI